VSIFILVSESPDLKNPTRLNVDQLFDEIKEVIKGDSAIDRASSLFAQPSSIIAWKVRIILVLIVARVEVQDYGEISRTLCNEVDYTSRKESTLLIIPVPSSVPER